MFITRSGLRSTSTFFCRRSLTVAGVRASRFFRVPARGLFACFAFLCRWLVTLAGLGGLYPSYVSLASASVTLLRVLGLFLPAVGVFAFFRGSARLPPLVAHTRADYYPPDCLRAANARAGSLPNPLASHSRAEAHESRLFMVCQGRMPPCLPYPRPPFKPLPFWPPGSCAWRHRPL